MTQFTFNFEKTYKEIDVAGTLYQVEFNDEAITKYQKAFKRFDKEIKVVTDKISDYESATDEVIEETAKKQKEVVKDIVETFLGEGTFDSLYEKAGKSSTNLMGLVHYLNGLYVEEERKKAEETRNKYLSNVKK
ncbi:hypothetical protein GTY48_15565 [Bacillus thuringiensis]|uniref:hypothetical protein n=1 Tax=Bacillus thuringiensis TaxID=1428 RepID=UPI0013689251|nr:hypothetical protein [Bacillus thuringiensis]MYW24985.1 hypothetical protein [Bacillus thuringiensis]MYW25064.1 hypothetical protein [Bacillus thuringiensis]